MFTVTSSKADYVDGSADGSYLARKRMTNKYTISYVCLICNSNRVPINCTSYFTFCTTFIQNPTLKSLCEMWISYKENSPPYNAPVNQSRAVRQVETGNWLDTIREQLQATVLISTTAFRMYRCVCVCVCLCESSQFFVQIYINMRLVIQREWEYTSVSYKRKVNCPTIFLHF